MSPNKQERTTTPGAGSSAGSGHPSTSYEAEAVEEDWMDFFDFDAYERDINGHSQRSTPSPETAMPSQTSTSFEPPTAPSFSLLTIIEHGTAPTTPVDNSLIPARNKDVHLKFGVNSLAGQEQESGEDIEVEMGEDAQTSDDIELEDVASAADVLSAAVSRTDTLSPFEPTPADSPGDVPTLSSINEQGGHCCKDSLRGSGDLDEPRKPVAEPPERDHGISTPQTKASSEVVSGSSESACTSCP
ncbi:hypothetical protein NEUTE1DRAFT_138123 [Neurospora tetrasperma FGSC 2508]|uniref:Uncharacterized protein n=1 Tax=Neurospora tetrasperma (strain FGSC 2508 / ATCC MYA-4615 / P0657) TaxID=510951 RepID=F8MLB8_NEUT8|nr:uncharacterized protein NEUTE1DRAFT_138123 [Neurospora tetrasperma FGSC 2508]EGO58391.1 hypothetical protein NEUTE1DRAFT_138123 [Neurospora tetrasperma FGSC 2508]